MKFILPYFLLGHAFVHTPGTTYSILASSPAATLVKILTGECVKTYTPNCNNFVVEKSKKQKAK